MITNNPAFVSNDDNILFSPNGHKLSIIHLSVHTEKARELVTSTGDPFRLELYPLGGLEYPCFKILLNMRIFQRVIRLLVLKSSGSPVFLNEEFKIKVFFSGFQRRYFLRLYVSGNLIGASW